MTKSPGTQRKVFVEEASSRGRASESASAVEASSGAATTETVTGLEEEEG